MSAVELKHTMREFVLTTCNFFKWVHTIHDECVQIFRLDTGGGTRGTACGLDWREDLQWARSLDEGWDLGRVKGVATYVVQRMQERGLGDALNWLDEGTEHPHRRGRCLE